MEHAARNTSPFDGDLNPVLKVYRLIALKRPASVVSDALWLHDFEGEQFAFLEEETVSSGLERALAFLQPRCPSGLLLCIFASSARSLHGLYGFVGHIKLVAHGRSTMANSVLRLLYPYLLRSCWQISDEEWEHLCTMAKQPILPASLPVAALSTAVEELRNSSINAWSREKAEILVDTVDATIKLTIQWRRELPRYVGDIDIYIRQPFDRFPELDTIQLLVLKVQDPQERRAVMACSSSDLMSRITATLRNSQSTYSKQSPKLSVQGQMFLLIQVIFSRMQTDVLEFIVQLTHQLNQMVPRTPKIRSFRHTC